MPNWMHRIQAAAKAFRLGPAVVHPGDTWGFASDNSAPTEYGDYIATSVGVYACVTYRSDNLAGLPFKVYEKAGNGEKNPVTSGALVDLLEKPNPFWTAEYLKYMTEAALGLWGEGFWILERGQNGMGAPKEIWWAKPSCMKPVKDRDNYLAGYVYEEGSVKMAFLPGEVVWFRYPDPRDIYGALSPIAAARLSIEMGHGALKANKRIFDKGYQLAGVISPKDDNARWSAEQVEGLQRMLERRFSGVDKAHSLAVLNQALNVQSLGLSPKDAEFLGMMGWTLADICRVYRVPPPLVQDYERATYSNIDQAYKGFWTDAMTPEARMFGATLTRQLAPAFGDRLAIEVDLSGVSVLQEDRTELTDQAVKWYAMGVPLNRLLQVYGPHILPEGEDGFPWGDEQPNGQAAAMPGALPGQAPAQPEGEDPAQAGKSYRIKAIALGSKEHEALWKRFDRRTNRHMARFETLTKDLMKRQTAAAVEGLTGSKGIHLLEAVTKDAADPFDMEEWAAVFESEAFPLLEEAASDAGDATLSELGVSMSFDVENPRVHRFIQARAQRFAQQVNETTWAALKSTISEGLTAGEGVDEIARRVEEAMGDRIRSSAETIARTEVIGALNGGALQAAILSDVVEGKAWLGTFDGRERETHAAAHETYQDAPIPLDADFVVGAGSGPAPGQLGAPEEDINCRCTLTWVVKGDNGATRMMRSKAWETIQRFARGGPHGHR